MRQSKQVLEWQEKAREEGREEGRREGEVQRARANVLRALTLRLQTPPPVDLIATVGTITDLDLLTRWLDAALTSDSLESFRAAI